MNCVDDCKYREMLDDANADLQELKAENEKLRSECDYWRVEQVHAYSNWEDTYKYAVKLKDENAKLRELVKAFDWCTEHFDLQNRCDKCPLEQSDKLTPECEVRMRELGIGVDYDKD